MHKPVTTAESSLTSSKSFVARYDNMVLDGWMIKFYGKTGYCNVGYWPGAGGPAEASQHLLEKLLDFFPSTPGSILDVACGFGASTHYLRRQFPLSIVVGINVSLKQLQSGHIAASNHYFVQMDAARLALPAAYFDRLLCIEAAFHFDTRYQFLQEAKRVLRPGGYIAVSDLLVRDPIQFGRWMIPTANDVQDRDRYLDQWQQAGFRDIEIIDATRVCWNPYCQNLLDALENAYRTGEIPKQKWDSSRSYFDALNRDETVQYLLVKARC